VYSFNKMNRFLPLVLVTFALLLSSCSERSEYGEASDYVKLGAACIATADVTAPTVTSESPADNTTYNSPATTVAVTFSEKMASGSVTTNTSDTTCSGSFQLSSDNFTTCIKMSAAPVASDNDTTLTITPASSLSAATTFKVKITTSVTDISCNTLGSDNKSIVGFSTSPSGSGTITGSVQMDNGSPLSGVSLIDELWGSTGATTTSDSDGDFSHTPLYLGVHSLTYSKNGYFDTNMEGLLETDGQTLVVDSVRLLPDNCTSGTMTGKITDAVTGDNMSGVHMWYANGLDKKWQGYNKGFSFFSLLQNGGWSLSKNAGYYTILSYKSGYYFAYHNVFACGNQADQNNSMSEILNPGEMRIMLKWRKFTPVTGTDLDSHLQIPDNASSTFHVYAISAAKTFYYATNSKNCSSCSSNQLSDNVTLDKDHNNNSSPASPPGDETITIRKVRSGTYSYSVHNYTNKDNSSITNLGRSGAKVNVIYCPVGADCSNEEAVIREDFNVPPKNGTLWRVFTFNSSDSGSGFTRVRTMTYESSRGNIY
jgi:hypothetical protein